MKKSSNSSIYSLLKPLLRLIASYIVLRVLLLIGLLSGLFFSLYRYCVGLYLSHKYKHPIVFAEALDAKYCINDEIMQSYQVLKGKCDIHKLRRRIDEQWLQPQSYNGRWTYTKLRQQLKLELGYYFWIPQIQFRIENHVILHDGSQLTDKNDLRSFSSKNSTLSMKNEILWQFILVNLPENHHILLFRAHHALMDRISMNRMYRKLFDDQEDANISLTTNNIFSNFGFIDKISFWSRLFGSAPYHFCKELLRKEEKHILHGPRLTGNKLIGISAPMALERLKNIMKHTDGDANDVLMACVFGALRTYFISEDQPIPSEMRLHVPIWLNTSQDQVKMENNATTQSVLAFINESFNNERFIKGKTHRDREIAPILYFTHMYYKFYVNRYPVCMMKQIVDRLSSSVVVSCLEVSTPKCLLGNEVIEQQIWLPEVNGVGGCGLAITMSWDVNRSIVCAVKADLGIMKSQENVDKLVGLVGKEFDEFWNIYNGNK
uniref:Diacylglycerol O-acyltransferase n=1 Tax=Strigamia maritima TaxID=126957 RepID=T1J8F7_STRMM